MNANPHTNSPETNAKLLRAVFGFAQFTRHQAEAVGLGDVLNAAHGRVKFVYCMGATTDGSVYQSAYEVFRCLA